MAVCLSPLAKRAFCMARSSPVRLLAGNITLAVCFTVSSSSLAVPQFSPPVGGLVLLGVECVFNLEI